MLLNTILFDVGGVLLTPLNDAAVTANRDRLAKELGFVDGEEMWQRFYCGREWALTKIGQWTDAQMWEALLSPLGLVKDIDRQDFLSRLFDGVGLKPEMRRLLENLNGRSRLSILSNASDKLDEILSDTLRVDGFFDVVVNSFEAGLAKPDERIYQLTLDRLGVTPQRLFFIDDQQRNTEAAAKLGIVSHVFTGVPALRSELVRLSLLNG